MPEQQQTTVKQSKTPLYISIVILAAIIACYFFIPSVNDAVKEAWNVLTSDDQERIEQWVGQFDFWGPVIIIVCMIFQMFLLVVPTWLLMVVTVLAYGPIWGSLIILAAVFAASSIGYAIGAYLGAPIVKKIVGEKGEKKIESFIDDYGFWAVIVTRVSPFLSNDAISFVGGMLRMGYWRFMGATMLGITPLTILIAWLGEENQRLKDGLIWGGAISIVLFVVYVWWDKRRRAED